MSALTHVGTALRFGCKGPAALAWFGERGIAVPAHANSWCGIASGDGGDDDWAAAIAMRLGASELFIEDTGADARLTAIARELERPIAGVYPVLREDRGFVLSGVHADAVLAETCNVNFGVLPVSERQVVMTMLTGVAVVVVPQGNAAQRRYRIWCDPSFGDYLQATLAEVLAGIESAVGRLT